MIAEPLEKGLAEDIENEVVQIGWTKWVKYFIVYVKNPWTGWILSHLVFNKASLW